MLSETWMMRNSRWELPLLPGGEWWSWKEPWEEGSRESPASGCSSVEPGSPGFCSGSCCFLFPGTLCCAIPASLCQGIDLARKLQNCFVAGSVFDPVSIMALQNVSVQCWESRSCRNGRGGKPLLNHSRYETRRHANRRHANSKSRKKGGGNGSLWGMQEGCEKGG